MTATELHLPIELEMLRAICKKHGVVKVSVFGSYARGEQTSESDLDLLVKCGPGISLFDVYDLQTELEHQTGVAVDVVTKINPPFLEYIEPDLINVAL